MFPDKVSTFSDRLNEMLVEKGLSQADLVRGSGIERSRISLYCSGRNDPKFDPIMRLSIFLDVNMAWLAGYDVPKQSETRISAINNKFETLNEEGKDKVDSYIDDLLESEKYRKP